MRRRDHTAVTVNEDDDYVVSSLSHEGSDSKAKYTSPDDLCLINDSCLRCGVCCCLRPCRRRGALDLYPMPCWGWENFSISDCNECIF